MMTPPLNNPMIPLVHPIIGGMFPGRMLRFQGYVPPHADRFEINLQTGPNSDADDIAFHFNPRFPEREIVRNHCTSEWGPEDRNGGMPLVPGQPFEALLLCDPNSIKVALNGAHFCEFPHRVPYQRISYLTVKGDVTMTMIAFEGAQAPPQQQGYMGQGVQGGAYGAPLPSHGAPGYGAPPQGQGVQGGAYGAPLPSYGAPGYGAPPQGVVF